MKNSKKQVPKKEKPPCREERKKTLLAALRESRGIISTGCEAAGVAQSVFKYWRKNDPEFAAEVENIMDEQGDFVENNLLKLIEKGDTAATIFYCKTKLKHRGYTEKSLPVPQKPVQAEDSEATVKAAQRKVKSKKDYIIKLLKKEGKYTAELSMQVTLTAELWVRAEQLLAEMRMPDYQQVLVQYSREGDKRESINPKEKLYMDMVSQIQRGLRSLGMNTDSKERRTDSDELGDFMKSINGDD